MVFYGVCTLSFVQAFTRVHSVNAPYVPLPSEFRDVNNVHSAAAQNDFGLHSFWLTEGRGYCVDTLNKEEKLR